MRILAFLYQVPTSLARSAFNFEQLFGMAAFTKQCKTLLVLQAGKKNPKIPN